MSLCLCVDNDMLVYLSFNLRDTLCTSDKGKNALYCVLPLFIYLNKKNRQGNTLLILELRDKRLVDRIVFN